MKLNNKIILSGINPSSSRGLHLGNYLGAAKQHVEIQDKARKAFYFIADYHSLNTVFDGKQVERNVQNTYLDYMAFGLRPEDNNVYFYVESAIPEIAELNLILNNVVSMAELKRMHAYKDKFAAGVDEDSINHGLFNYPVLMAADILAFGTDVVPVGEDQSQHVEMARTIARHFNNKYGEVFKVPELFVKEETARVLGTDGGENKMSKSLGNDISVFADEATVRKQIFATVTDPNRIHPDDAGDPQKNVLFEYMKFLDFDENRREKYIERYKEGKVGDVEIKEAFLKHYLDYFSEMRKRRKRLESDTDKVDEIMMTNNYEAREIVIEKLDKVKKAVGLFKGAATKQTYAKFDDFMKLDIRICEIKKVEKHPDADKLLKLKLDDGMGGRQILAGIADFVEDLNSLVGMKIPVIVNLESKILRGEISEGMMLATDNTDGIVFLNVDRDVKIGERVR